jgi:hypothetical protein
MPHSRQLDQPGAGNHRRSAAGATAQPLHMLSTIPAAATPRTFIPSFANLKLNKIVYLCTI